MPWQQHVLRYEDYLAAGGEPPDEAYAPTDETIVVVCLDPETGVVAWVSYAESDTVPETRLNADVPAFDWRQ